MFSSFDCGLCTQHATFVLATRIAMGDITSHSRRTSVQKSTPFQVRLGSWPFQEVGNAVIRREFMPKAKRFCRRTSLILLLSAGCEKSRTEPGSCPGTANPTRWNLADSPEVRFEEMGSTEHTALSSISSKPVSGPRRPGTRTGAMVGSDREGCSWQRSLGSSVRRFLA
jgi:hypothetical protein